VEFKWTLKKSFEIYNIKTLTKIREETKDKHFINKKKRFECSKPSDLIQMSNLFVYLQRKEEKQSLEILLTTNQKEEPY
jgi:hypothetical protein